MRQGSVLKAGRDNFLLAGKVLTHSVLVWAILGGAGCATNSASETPASPTQEAQASPAQQTIRVESATGLSAALKDVSPGTTILLEDGLYTSAQLSFDSGGSAKKKCTLVAVNPGKAVFTGETTFELNAPHWVFQGLAFRETTSGEYGLFSLRASHVRVTDCFFMRTNGDSAPWVYTHPTEAYSPYSVRYLRLDHSSFISLGRAQVSRWLSGGNGFVFGNRRYFYGRTAGERAKELDDLDAEGIRNRMFLQDLDTPSYVRIDHCYIAMPTATKLFSARVMVQYDVPAAAKSLNIALRKVPEEYRNKTIMPLAGILLDSNLIDMHGYTHMFYPKSSGVTWSNNTIYNGTMYGWLYYYYYAFHNFQFAGKTALSCPPSINFPHESNIIAGNYIEHGCYNNRFIGRKRNRLAPQAAIRMRSGRMREEGVAEPFNLMTDSLIANNVISLRGERAQAAFHTDESQAKEPATRAGKFWGRLAMGYGTSVEELDVAHLYSLPKKNTVINNIVLSGGSENHTLFGFTESSPWQEVFSLNQFANNYCDAVLLKDEYRTGGGFSALPENYSERFLASFDSSAGMKMRRNRVPNHPYLPYDMESFIFDRALEKLPSLDYDGATRGICEFDLADFGDTLALNRPLDFADVGTTWFDKEALEILGLQIRNYPEPVGPGGSVDFPMRLPPGELTLTPGSQ